MRNLEGRTGFAIGVVAWLVIALTFALSGADPEPAKIGGEDKTLKTMIELVAMVPNSAGCNQVGSTICCFDWDDNAFCCDQKKPGDCPRLKLELRLGTTHTR